MTKDQRIEVDREVLAVVCRKHKIRKLSFFGSVLREDFHDESDIDVLVEFEPDARVGFLKLAEIEAALDPFCHCDHPVLSDYRPLTHEAHAGVLTRA